MKFSLLATALVAGVTAVVGTAATARGTVTPGVVTVSCFRGPWTEVIWDRPNPVFVDSLVYDFQLADTTVAAGSRKFADSTKTGQVQTLLIPVTLDFVQAQEMARRQLLQGEKLQAQVQAYCRLPLVGIRRYDFNREVDLAIPVIPGAELLLQQF